MHISRNPFGFCKGFFLVINKKPIKAFTIAKKTVAIIEETNGTWSIFTDGIVLKIFNILGQFWIILFILVYVKKKAIKEKT